MAVLIESMQTEEGERRVVVLNLGSVENKLRCIIICSSTIDVQ